MESHQNLVDSFLGLESLGGDQTQQNTLEELNEEAERLTSESSSVISEIQNLEKKLEMLENDKERLEIEIEALKKRKEGFGHGEEGFTAESEGLMKEEAKRQEVWYEKLKKETESLQSDYDKFKNKSKSLRREAISFTQSLRRTRIVLKEDSMKEKMVIVMMTRLWIVQIELGMLINLGGHHEFLRLIEQLNYRYREQSKS